MGQDGAAFLRQSHHIEDRAAFSFNMCSHGDNGADRHNAGTTNTGHQHGIRLFRRWQLRIRQCFKNIRHSNFLGRYLWFLQICAVYGHETRTEAVDARVVFVTGGLIDRAFATELRFFRDNGETVRFDRAIAATLAYQIVDHYAFKRIGECSPAPPAAFLGRTGLIVH